MSEFHDYLYTSNSKELIKKNKMAEYRVNIKIERMEEDGEVYYLATSDDIQGLVVQADTLSEAIEIAEDSVRELIDIHKKLGNPLPIHKTDKHAHIKKFKIPLAVPA